MNTSSSTTNLTKHTFKTNANKQEKTEKEPNVLPQKPYNERLRKVRIMGMGLSVLPFKSVYAFKNLALEKGEEQVKQKLDIKSKDKAQDNKKTKHKKNTRQPKESSQSQETDPKNVERYFQQINKLALGSFAAANQAIEQFVDDSKENGLASKSRSLEEPNEKAKLADTEETDSKKTSRGIAHKARQISCFSRGFPRTTAQLLQYLIDKIDTYGKDTDLNLRQLYRAGRERRSDALNHLFASWGLVSKQEVFELNKQLSIVSRELSLLYKATNKKAPISLDRRGSERRLAPASMNYEERLIARRESDRPLQNA